VANGEKSVPKRAKTGVVDAPIVGPLTEEEWVKATHRAMLRKDVTLEERQEYRKLLDLHPEMSKDYGDQARHYRSAALKPFEAQPILEESIKHRNKIMRQELAGPNPSPLELLLVDVVIAAYQDYWAFATVYKQSTGQSFRMRDMGEWERILSSKETRYLRAVETLARVRRLLKLPQVNINLPGGQQINVAGDVRHSGA
jgi:hypothetical protein